MSTQDQRGKNNPNWKGGRTIDKKGYVRLYRPDHPRQHNGYVLEHIAIIEEKIGRSLFSNEKVKHIDGNKWNNDLGNLEIFKVKLGSADPDEVIRLVKSGLSLKKISETTDRSISAISFALNQAGTSFQNERRIIRDSVTCVVCKRPNDKHHKFCNSCATRAYRILFKYIFVTLAESKCHICGWSGNFAALQFHHKDGNEKLFHLGVGLRWPWENVIKEVNKCSLICANCHKKEHAVRIRLVLSALINNKFYSAGCRYCGEGLRYECRNCKLCLKRHKRKVRVIEMLGGKCFRCGLVDDAVVFNCHHPNNDKLYSVGKLFSSGSWEKIENEARKCILLCVRCHQIEHSDYENKSLLRAGIERAAANPMIADRLKKVLKIDEVDESFVRNFFRPLLPIDD